MNLKEQKKLLETIFNYKQHIEEDHINNVVDFETQISDTIKNKLKMSENDTEEKVTINDIFEWCSKNNLEPMQLLDYIAKKIEEIGDIHHSGQTIQFSKTGKIMEQIKKNFINHEDLDDINNF